MSDGLDKRLHAYREDLADETLKGKVTAGKFVRGEIRRIILPEVDILSAPNDALAAENQLLYGDVVRVFEDQNGWLWLQSVRDNYVGYAPSGAAPVVNREVPASTHIVAVPRTFSYLQPDMKTARHIRLSYGCVLSIVGETEVRGTKYVETADGFFLIARHVAPVGRHFDDYVTVAETLLHTPYLWGGSSAYGMDCSGLVQLSMLMVGKRVQRDTDMQADTIGSELGFAAMDGDLQRGDLVFWKGHVGIMRDRQELIHANGHTMNVATELLEDAIERIGYLYGFPTILRRPQ